MNDHELAAHLAERAGALLLEMRAEAAVAAGDEDAAWTLAKKADAASNDYLIEQLRTLRPLDAILSEESSDSADRLSAQRVWIIDPVDGTYEFARSLPEFAVHVALWDADQQSLIAGAVSIPNHNLVWSTGDNPLDLDVVPVGRPLTIVTSPREPQSTVDQLVAALNPIAAERGMTGVEVIHAGSVGGKLHQILADAADVYVSTVGFYEWDSAAPCSIALHHGLAMTDITGRPLTFNQMPPRTPSFMASRPWLADIVRAALVRAGD